MEEQKVKDDGLQAKLKELDAELSKSDDSIQKWDAKKVQEQKKRAKLVSNRCDLLVGQIFVDSEQFINDCLVLIKNYKCLTDMVGELGSHSPGLYEHAQAEKKDGFWLTVADSFLRPDRLRGKPLGTFMNDLCSLSEGLKDKTPYPDLRRDF